MWLLIEVGKQEDVGKDEQRRILIDDGCMDIFEDGCGMVIECNGIDVHPNTPKRHEMDEERKLYDIHEKCKSCEYLKEPCVGCMENGFIKWKMAITPTPHTS